MGSQRGLWGRREVWVNALMASLGRSSPRKATRRGRWGVHTACGWWVVSVG